MKPLAKVVSCLDGYDPDALPVDTARAAIRACLEPLRESERVGTRDALGRVLAEDIVPAINVPAHHNSAMDGWALRGADLLADREVALKEAGTALAGRPFRGEVGPGQCVRIMTGAVMPRGADTVVIQEVVRRDGNRVLVPAGQKAGQNVRAAGEDIQAGVAALKAGNLVRAAELGLIASLGIADIIVKRRLRVAYFSTGDELTAIGKPLPQGAIYDSNRYTLHAMLAPLGMDVTDMGVVRDDPAKLETAFRSAAAKADAVITTGGVSVGEADFVKQLMGKLGEVLFWKIAMRPGRPMAFGRIGAGRRAPFLFGLPGNPVAVMVTFHQFVREALLLLAGRGDDCRAPLLPVQAAHAMRKVPGRTEYQRGVVFREAGHWKARTTGQQGSGVLRSMSEANCYIVLEHERGTVQPGEPVQVQLFEGLE
ncbi:MAG: molybdopterin molybdotransferase MoeA [Betaproteobacteria bacterium]|nr:molybdopterin molybdotransferase MoeA [Betaproteobacteria bacterium]